MEGDGMNLRKLVSTFVNDSKSSARRLEEEVQSIRRHCDSGFHTSIHQFREFMRAEEHETKKLQELLSHMETRNAGTPSLKDMVEKVARLHAVMVRDVGLLEGHLRNYGYSLVHPDPAPEDPFANLLAERAALGDCVPMEGVTTVEPEVVKATTTLRDDHQQGASPATFAKSPLLSPRHRKSMRTENQRKSLLSEASSDNFLAKSSPISLALRNKYGGTPADTEPSLAVPIKTPSRNVGQAPQDMPQDSFQGSPAPLQQSSARRNSNCGDAQGGASRARKYVGSTPLSGGFKVAGDLPLQIPEEENQQANTPQMKSPRPRLSFFDDQMEPVEANSCKDSEMGGLGAAKSVQLGLEEYNSLPGYMKSLSYQDMQEGLTKIKKVFEDGQASLGAEEIEQLGIGYSASFIHCLISLEYLARGFKCGKMVYEKGSRLSS